MFVNRLGIGFFFAEKKYVNENFLTVIIDVVLADRFVKRTQIFFKMKTLQKKMVISEKNFPEKFTTKKKYPVN